MSTGIWVLMFSPQGLSSSPVHLSGPLCLCLCFSVSVRTNTASLQNSQGSGPVQSDMLEISRAKSRRNTIRGEPKRFW